MKRRQFFKLAAVAAATPFLPKSTPAEAPRKKYEHQDIAFRSEWNRYDPQTGVLDTVKSSREDQITANSDIFYAGQRIEIYASDLKTYRGSRKIVRIQGHRIFLNSRVPSDTSPGDLILLGMSGEEIMRKHGFSA